MDARTVADIEEWERRPFDGSAETLHELADEGFSGVVRSADTYLLYVSGRPVGAFEYREDRAGETTVEVVDASTFPDASGDAFVAPHEALPLLYAMRAVDGETRGRYYTNNTPLREVDRTLQNGGFTGYLELSENVLSGDYFVVYHGGKRRSVAFVGQSRRLRTDDEAFDLAADEVGIYEVVGADLPTVDLPDRPEPANEMEAGAAATATESADDAGPEPEPESGSESEPEVDDPDARVEGDGQEAYGEADEGATETEARTGAETGAGTGTGGAVTGAGTAAGAAAGASAGTTETDADANGSDRDDGADPAEPGAEDSEGATDAPDETGPATGETSEASEAGPADDTRPGDADAEEPERSGPDADARTAETVPGEGEDSPDTHEATPADVEAATAAVEATETTPASEADEEDAAHVVPSVDPDRTARADAPAEPAPDSDADAGDAGPDSTGEPTAEEQSGSGGGGETDTDAGASDDEAQTATGGAGAGPTIVDGETRRGLREELDEREREVERLTERLSEVEAERDEFRARVEELERQLDAAGVARGASRSLAPAEALAGTSLFVRYRSKREPTLADALEGASREAVNENLRLEHHTQFETDDVEVEGKSFEAFLAGTQAHAFVEWLVCDLPYEIRDTGNAESVAELYDALARLDRVEFDARVDHEEGESAFDVVGRGQMGQPLVVANLEESRTPMDDATMGELVTTSNAVAQSHEELAGAFAVTAAYFEPAAMETARDATGGSLLSRDRRKSFVKLSRKRGYHLCLVEDREESFYLSVPEL